MSLILLSLLGLVAVAPVAAQLTLQPEVALIFAAGEGLDEREAAAQELLEAAVEGRLRALRRYRLTRLRSDDDPDDVIRRERLSGASLFVRVVERRDGTMRVESDLWDGNAFVWSQEDPLPAEDDRFDAASTLARAADDALVALFGGFGRVRFAPSGARVSYYIYVDDEAAGADLDAIELPAGRYEIEIRRRDGGFEQVVGRSDLDLAADEFVELQFDLKEQPPPIPGFMRLTNPADRWRSLFDIRGTYLIETGLAPELSPTLSTSAIATALINDAPLRGFVFGFEGGWLSARYLNESQDEITLEMTPLMMTLGLGVGPVAGVDFIVRGSAGMALTSVEITTSDSLGGTSSARAAGWGPVFGGVAEFGFGLFGDSRLSLSTSWFGLVELTGTEVATATASITSYIGIGLGFGGRF